ncbi:MAG TPA: hypothetical protein G4O12_06800 [Dehalococcoidia bacterium]|nr:hypothetical protein [Dehalococcoidia bacterium]
MNDLDIWDMVTSFRLTKERKIDHLDPRSIEDKPMLTKDIEDHFAMIDSSGMCNFPLICGPDEDNLRALLETATGIDLGGYKGYMKTGERIHNQERLFILKAGFTGKDDTLPKRMLEEPVPDGPQKGQVSRLSEMLPEYYKLRGWDSSGVPTQEKLKELGLA